MNSSVIKVILKAIEGAPATFQLLPWGEIDIEDEGKGVVDEEAIAAMIADFERRGNDLVIDYEHQTMKDVQAPAAGWIRKLVDKGKDGLWAVVEWTAKAREYLEAREYRYYSPVMWIRKSDRRILKLENVALTNFPKINQLAPIIAKMEAGQEGNLNHEEEGKTMLKKLRKLLGLADDAGEDKVVEAAEKLAAKANRVAAKEVLDAIGVKEDVSKDDAVKAVSGLKSGKAEVVACKEVLDALEIDASASKEDAVQAVAGLKTTGTAAEDLSKQVAKLTSQLAEMKRDDLVALALKEGKTSPDELDKWGRDLAKNDPKRFELIVLSRAPGSVIPVGTLPEDDGGHRGKVDEAVLAVAKAFGLTEEDLKKYGGLDEA